MKGKLNMVCSFFDKMLYLLTTSGLFFVFFVKSCFNEMIRYLLGFIVAAGIVLDTTGMRKAYIVLTLFIIMLLVLDNTTKQLSKTFDLLSTIFRPINLGQGMKKIVKYNKFKHIIQLSVFELIELLKIFSGIYCIIAISIEDITGTWIIYWLLGALLIESILGLIIYGIFIVLTLVKPNFYFNLLRTMAKWYLDGSVDCRVYMDKGRVVLEFNDLP